MNYDDDRERQYIDKKWRTTVKGRTIKRQHYKGFMNIVDKMKLNKRRGLTHQDERIDPELNEKQREYDIIVMYDAPLTKSENEWYFEIAQYIIIELNKLIERDVN